jgi:Sporulation and spore germination
VAVRLSAAAVLGSCLLGLVACGSAKVEREADAADRRPTARATIYFLTDQGRAPLGVRRTVERVPWSRGGMTRAALEVLLAGPTPEEKGAGITTAIPPGTTIRSLRFRGHGGSGAIIDLIGLPDADGADGVRRVRINTQVARTVIGSGGIRRIWLRSSGGPWGLWLMGGGIDDRAIDYDTLHGYNVCAAKPGTEAVPGDCFAALP